MFITTSRNIVLKTPSSEIPLKNQRNIDEYKETRNMKRKTLLSWSSGKDCAYALYKLQQNPEVDLAGLFCTVNKEFDRVAMHGVRLELLKEQARNIGLPLEIIEIPYPCSNADYETIMKQFVERARNNQITDFAFGDLFLEDIRSYREEKLKDSGIEASFPIWGIPTDELARAIIASGIKAVITCVDPKQISKDFVGREFDDRFLAALPATVDPCGENGEFHSFVFDDPMFKRPVDIVMGDTSDHEGFAFADVLPAP